MNTYSLGDSIKRDLAIAPPPATSGPFSGLSATDRAPHEEILHRAYAIWQREAHPEGRQLEHWLQAEAEVLTHA